MTFLVKNWSRRIKKIILHMQTVYFISKSDNNNAGRGILVSLQVVFQRFYFSPLILGDKGKKIYKNVLLLTDFDSKYRHKIKSLDIGKSIS